MANKAAQQLGKRGGKVKSEAKTKAAKENGKLGGRPRKAPWCKIHPTYLEDGCETCETWFHVRILDEEDFVYRKEDYEKSAE